MLFTILFLCLFFQAKAEFLKGVNYGNRFVPEDWMAGDGDSIYGGHYGSPVNSPNDVARVSLCDVTDDRILRWLDDTIKEDDFMKMKDYGVKLLRLPTGPENNGKPEHYFNTDWNKEIAVDVVGKIVEKCQQYPNVCWGIGVLNEPQPSGNGASPNDDELHQFLDRYYDEAIMRVRDTMAWDFPVVLFSWTYDFGRWSDNRYPYNQYGSIVWDTHTYTGGSSNLDEVLGFYDWDLGQIQDFQNRQSAPMIIGEFAFSNLNRGESETDVWQQYADRIFPKFMEKVQAGALIWNFDCQYASWS